MGDVLLSTGVFPDRTQGPSWAYHSTGASGVNALGCSLEALGQRRGSEHEIQVILSVNRSVGSEWGGGGCATSGGAQRRRGACEGSFAWDERGKKIADPEFHLVRDGTAKIRSDNTAVLWH